MQPKPVRRILLSLLALILVFSALLFVPAVKSFAFTDNRSGGIAAYLRIQDPAFQIKYIHSIHLSEVLEHYKVLPDDSLQLVRLEYEDFNVGMPSNAGEGETFVEKDGKYTIDGMDRKLEEFRLLVGDVDAGLYFLADGEEYDLKKTLARGKSYTFHVQRLSVYQLLKGVNLDER